MGHRLSKTTQSGSNAATEKSQRKRNSKNPCTSSGIAPHTNQNQSSNCFTSVATASAANLEQHNLGPTIRVISGTQQFHFQTRPDSTSSAYNNLRQIIIKIQLAKMEPGENDSMSATTDGVAGSNNNLNVERSNLTVNAISFQRNIACDQGNEIKLNNLNVGSSAMLNNNNFVSNFAAVPFVGEESGDVRNLTNLNIMVQQMGNCQIMDNAADNRQESNNNEGGSNRSSTSSTELCDVMAEIVEQDVTAATGCSTTSAARTTICGEEGKRYCCRRKKSSSGAAQSSNAGSSSSAYPSKWRCCKCSCRDALKKFRPNNKKQNQQPPHNENIIAEVQPVVAAPLPTNEMHPTAGNHLAIWSPANDVIIPLASPQLVVVQYPPTSAVSHLVSLGTIDEHAIRLVTSDLTVPATPDSTNSMAVSPCSTLSIATTPNGTVVHSQVDYIHCLVPDLERITKSSFYWGKMDRYEAERLLEGKPEGTFLLRDSAQEEYLFSVTFRKYGRSLHARIEQYNHRFSFDCHDPGVFTASTVTGLLEHYKDPSCVMFFEPMLAIPLHRNTTFSLQQLCRATIVSNTTYDGITELEIPSRLKSYLKEYHYKQRVRVKPFDEPFYSCT